MTVLSRTPIRFDVGVPKQFDLILRAARTEDMPLRNWRFVVPQMVADSYVQAIARRQGDMGVEFLVGVWDYGLPTYGGVPLEIDDTVDQIVLHDGKLAT